VVERSENISWKNIFPNENRYFETEKGILYLGDALEILKDFLDESIDIVITSPPYNVDLGNNKYHKRPYDLYNDNREHHEYIAWLKEIFAETYRLLPRGGRVCINIGDSKNGAVPTSSDVIQFMKEIGYIPYTHIIWDKMQIRNRAAWGSFCSPAAPSFPTPFEHILVFAKETRKLQKRGDSDLTKEEFIEFSIALWRFPPETRQKQFGHPAMFPEELPYRLIKMLSWIGDTVLDMFAGAGTTLVVAEKLRRKWIGIELSPAYCAVTKKRIAELQSKLF